MSCDGILIVQRSLVAAGGGNAVAAWMVHALAGDHDVATLTAAAWSAAETNAFYGTSIPDDGITKHVVPAPWRWLSGLPEDRLTRLRMCSVLRSARAAGGTLRSADHRGQLRRRLPSQASSTCTSPRTSNRSRRG